MVSGGGGRVPPFPGMMMPAMRAMIVAVAAHGCSSTQYSPSVATSFFQMGTVSFKVSMA